MIWYTYIYHTVAFEQNNITKVSPSLSLSMQLSLDALDTYPFK